MGPLVLVPLAGWLAVPLVVGGGRGCVPLVLVPLVAVPLVVVVVGGGV